MVVHLFVAADGNRDATDRDGPLNIWRACVERLGLSEVALSDVGPDPDLEGDSGFGSAGLLAARTRPGPGVHQAVLRREHDMYCLSVMLEPDPSTGIGWSELDRDWNQVVESMSTRAIGSARLFLAHSACTEALNHDPHPIDTFAELPSVASNAPGSWREYGTPVQPGFTVWEVSEPIEDRSERRIIILAPGDLDRELSAWAWIGPGRRLPPFAEYLLHAAKLRYQLRVWNGGQEFRQLRRAADATVTKLLETLSLPQREPSRVELLEAATDLASLQARELGLVDSSTRLREMQRTVAIASSNLAVLSEDAARGGLFADDHGLAEWFGRQLDDDATYLETALRRSEKVSALVDQRVQQSRQHRQESVNIGLTGAVGAIVMGLGAVQAFQYVVPLPPPLKPAVIAMLGALALFAALIVLRVIAPSERWSSVLLCASSGLVGSALAWIVVAAAVPRPGTTETLLWSGAGFIFGTFAAIVMSRPPRKKMLCRT